MPADPAQQQAPTLSITGASKRFAGVVALDDVSVDLRPGEVHALVGENGAGKSTLIKLMTGVYSLDEGELRFEGQPRTFKSAREAQQAGIQTIYQEVFLAPQLSVARNMFLGREPQRFGSLNLGKMNRDSQEILERYGIVADVRRPLGDLGLGVQQMVAVARAVSQDAKVVIMDEPTSSLEPREIDKLLSVVALLRQQGVAIVYVSHKMDEIFRACDVVTVLRDGKLVSTDPVSAMTRRTLVSRMLGREATDVESGRTQLSARAVVDRETTPALQAQEVSRKLVLEDISLTVHPGEIVGLAGLLGSGRSETARAVFGAMPVDSGSVAVGGEVSRHRSPAASIRRGVAMLPEDRKVEGIIPGMSIRDNIALAALPQLSRGGFINRRRQDEIVEVFMRRLRIRASGPLQRVSELSGGNQQKVLLARLLCLNPKVLILDEPTRGIDVGAKAEVQALIAELAEKGLGVMLISSELEEVVEGSDTVLVLRDGAALGTLFGDEISEDSIMNLIAGAAADTLETTTP
ncbi:ribose transport system ATP-binding protein [Motilibacter peucedani]|uniref:Ribose transport system ATP-binding protein n=1 Tax=Motilibacter peucedani TaxID=598650 RepID=A0A420XU92_9ACTN|nr:sugar ABC transporter ATP-binding protein [Motilibacter peucedani]RKS80413.1 ribose transport system ATP-binding protein [Motilibacter peucedani]